MGWQRDHATKVKSLIRAAKYFRALARRYQIMLHLPDRRMCVFPWEPDYPIGALQSKAFCECGLPRDRQRLQCLGQDIQGATLGAAGVLPGDVIDVMDVRR